MRSRAPVWQRAGRAIGRWFVDWSLALPLIIVALLMLVAPSVVMVLSSFTDNAGNFTLENWTATFSSRASQQAIGNSLLLGTGSATISLLVGTPLAWIIARMTRFGRSWSLGVLNVAANFSGIGLGFAYVAALGTYGMITLLFQHLGLPFSPPGQNSFWGLMIAYEYTNAPLFILLSLPAMHLVKDEWWEAAQTSSATRLQFWRHVGLPVLGPFLAADWLLIFTWSVGMYGLPLALVGDNARSYRLITIEMGHSLLGSLFGVKKVPVYAVFLMLLASVSLITYRIIVRRAARCLD
ncbi:MAG: hypothetical protein ABWY00_07260 [Dongiaceae bacterium]